MQCYYWRAQNGGTEMEYVTLEAGETRDGKKVVIATQDRFPIAENIDDIIEMANEDHGWNTDEIVAAYQSDQRSTAISKKLELERQADASR